MGGSWGVGAISPEPVLPPPSSSPPPGRQVTLEILFRYKHFFRSSPGGRKEKQASWEEAPPGHQVTLVPGEGGARAEVPFPRPRGKARGKGRVTAEGGEPWSRIPRPGFTPSSATGSGPQFTLPVKWTVCPDASFDPGFPAFIFFAAVRTFPGWRGRGPEMLPAQPLTEPLSATRCPAGCGQSEQLDGYTGMPPGGQSWGSSLEGQGGEEFGNF